MTILAEQRTEEEPSELSRLQRRLRTLTATVIGLALALLGLGVWTVFDYVNESSTAVPDEVKELLDDYRAAWSQGNSEAFLGLVSEQYVFEDGWFVVNAEERAAVLDGWADRGLNIEAVGEPIMATDGTYWIVAQANRETESGSVSAIDGISTYTIVVRDGRYVIARHIWTGT